MDGTDLRLSPELVYRLHEVIGQWNMSKKLMRDQKPKSVGLDNFEPSANHLESASLPFFDYEKARDAFKTFYDNLEDVYMDDIYGGLCYNLKSMHLIENPCKIELTPRQMADESFVELNWKSVNPTQMINFHYMVYGVLNGRHYANLWEPETLEKMGEGLTSSSELENAIATTMLNLASRHSEKFVSHIQSNGLLVDILYGLIHAHPNSYSNYCLILEAALKWFEVREIFRRIGGLSIIVALLDEVSQMGKDGEDAVYYLNRVVFMMCLSFKSRVALIRHDIICIQSRILFESGPEYVLPSLAIIQMLIPQPFVKAAINPVRLVKRLLDIMVQMQNATYNSVIYSTFSSILDEPCFYKLLLKSSKVFIKQIESVESSDKDELLQIMKIQLTDLRSSDPAKTAETAMNLLWKLNVSKPENFEILLYAIDRLMYNFDFVEKVAELGLVKLALSILNSVNVKQLVAALRILRKIMKHHSVRFKLPKKRFVQLVWLNLLHDSFEIWTEAAKTLTAAFVRSRDIFEFIEQIPSWFVRIESLCHTKRKDEAEIMCHLTGALSERKQFMEILASSKIPLILINWLAINNERFRDSLTIALTNFLRDPHVRFVLVNSVHLQTYLNVMSSLNPVARSKAAHGASILCQDKTFRSLVIFDYFEKYVLKADPFRADFNIQAHLLRCLRRCSKEDEEHELGEGGKQIDQFQGLEMSMDFTNML